MNTDTELNSIIAQVNACASDQHAGALTLHAERRLIAEIVRLSIAAGEPRHDNGAPMYDANGMLLDRDGNRSIFDDVDE